MRSLVTAVLIGGLMAAGLLAGCGGGGGSSPTPTDPEQGIVLRGIVEKWTPVGNVPAVGYTVTLKGNRKGVTNAAGAFGIQLDVGETMKTVYPSADPITPPLDYVFSVSEPVTDPPSPPIFGVEYPKGTVHPPYPAEAIEGGLNVWWGNTNDFGTLVIQ